MRKIIHIDMDAFYAAVEQRDFPELAGKPIAVGGSSKRGVVASASYEARKYGVRSAMPSVVATRKCPGLIFVKARFEVYRQVSTQIREIFLEYTDLVEPLSLDEAYLDVTHNHKAMRSATLMAEEIRKKIYETTQLTASAGISFNKFLAKTASDINKPNGLKVIHPKEALTFLDELPIHKFHGIGKVTAERMKKMNIHTGADLKKLSQVDLVKRFGKMGLHFYHIVRAEDERPVNPNRIRKSIGAERTFSEDLTTIQAMQEKTNYLCEVVHNAMVKKDNFGRTLTLKVKYADFTIITRSRSFGGELREAAFMKETALKLLKENIQDGDRVRLLGISVSNLSQEQIIGGIQLSFDF